MKRSSFCELSENAGGAAADGDSTLKAGDVALSLLSLKYINTEKHPHYRQGKQEQWQQVLLNEVPQPKQQQQQGQLSQLHSSSCCPSNNNNNNAAAAQNRMTTTIAAHSISFQQQQQCHPSQQQQCHPSQQLSPMAMVQQLVSHANETTAVDSFVASPANHNSSVHLIAAPFVAPPPPLQPLQLLATNGCARSTAQPPLQAVSLAAAAAPAYYPQPTIDDNKVFALYLLRQQQQQQENYYRLQQLRSLLYDSMMESHATVRQLQHQQQQRVPPPLQQLLEQNDGRLLRSVSRPTALLPFPSRTSGVHNNTTCTHPVTIPATTPATMYAMNGTTYVESPDSSLGIITPQQPQEKGVVAGTQHEQQSYYSSTTTDDTMNTPIVSGSCFSSKTTTQQQQQQPNGAVVVVTDETAADQQQQQLSKKRSRSVVLLNGDSTDAADFGRPIEKTGCNEPLGFLVEAGQPPLHRTTTGKEEREPFVVQEEDGLASSVSSSEHQQLQKEDNNKSTTKSNSKRIRRCSSSTTNTKCRLPEEGANTPFRISKRREGVGQTSGWRMLYNKLQEFKTHYGHTRVPENFEDNKLANWVANQRRAMARFQRGIPFGRFDQLRVDLLEAIGFEWSRPRIRPNNTTIANNNNTNNNNTESQPKGQQQEQEQAPLYEHFTWDEMFQKLVQFQDEHGHVRVPVDENPRLANWIRNQRTARSRMQRGMPYRCLNTDRVERLVAISFPWTVTESYTTTTISTGAAVVGGVQQQQRSGNSSTEQTET